MFSLRYTVAAAAISIIGSSAGAITFSAIGETGSFSGDAPGTPYSLSTQIDFELTGINTIDSTTTWTFDVDVSNNTVSPGGGSRLTIFGWNSTEDPIEDSGTIDNGWKVNDSGATVPNGLGTFEFCAADVPSPALNNCSGGATSTIGEGDTEAFVVSFDTDTSGGVQVSFGDIFVRYQSINFLPEGESSFATSWAYTLEPCADGDCPEPPDHTPIPLPAAGWMLLAGVGGLAAMRRRRKS